MENIFLNFIQHVSDNRFWIMPVIFAAVAVGIVNMLVCGFRED